MRKKTLILGIISIGTLFLGISQAQACTLPMKPQTCKEAREVSDGIQRNIRELRIINANLTADMKSKKQLKNCNKAIASQTRCKNLVMSSTVFKDVQIDLRNVPINSCTNTSEVRAQLICDELAVVQMAHEGVHSGKRNTCGQLSEIQQKIKLQKNKDKDLKRSMKNCF